MFEITGSFLASFKIGDNIHHNIDIVNALYKANRSLEEREANLLEKPITVTLVSICEALIYDFIKRCQWYTKEGVTGLPRSSLEKLRSSKPWSMEKKIKLFEELNVLQTSDNQVYVYLEKLAQLRNRIHIQNEKQNFETDEIEVFTTARRVEAEKMVELLMRKISTLYPRPSHIQLSQYVNNFELPWKPHF